jgi:hypothetical protein
MILETAIKKFEKSQELAKDSRWQDKDSKLVPLETAYVKQQEKRLVW